MSIIDPFLSEKLIEDCVRATSLKDQAIVLPLKEQVVTRLAIRMCQCIRLKEDFGSKFEYPFFTLWKTRIGEQCSAVVEELPLPCLLKPLIIHRLWLIAIRFFGWIREYRFRLPTTPRVTDQFVTPSDWTAEGKINERKVAERLVQDERIPVFERYKLACLYFLEPHIRSLWEQNPQEQRFTYGSSDNLVVMLWSNRLIGGLEEDTLRKQVFKAAVREGLITSVVYCWNLLREDDKQEFILEAALFALLKFEFSEKEIQISGNFLSDHLLLNSTRVVPECYSDISYFLFLQMSEKQRIQFLKSFLDSKKASNGLQCFLKSPYQNYFIPIITNLWNILPEKSYGQLWEFLAVIYRTVEIEKVYQYYDYGYLLIKLLEQTPNNYYRYAFANFSSVHDLFSSVLRITPFQCRNIKIIQNILKHATAEDKQLFMSSCYGQELCKSLINSGHLDVLDAILADCLPEYIQADFKKNFLISTSGKEACFWIVARENEESADSLLKWGCFSKDEISDFKHKLIWDVLLRNGRSVNSLFDYTRNLGTAWDPTKALTTLLEELNTDSVDRVLQWFLPSEGVRRHFKEQFMSFSKLLDCCKNIWLLQGSCDLKSLLSKLTHLLCYTFSSEKDIKRFKRQLFAIRFPQNVLRKLVMDEQWLYVKIFIGWFELSSKQVKQLKQDVMWEDNTRRNIFYLLKDSDTKAVSFYLKWGLSDAETVRAFKTKVEVSDFSFRESLDKEEAQLWQQIWDQLINDRLSDLARKRSDKISDFERNRLQERSNPRKKFKRH